MGNLIDETGNRYGQLTVLERSENSGTGEAQWICACDCGTTSRVRGYNLRQGRTNSCGCLKLTCCRTHGCYTLPEYTAWRHMRLRCNELDHPQYPDYGGRGITVCDRWQSDLTVFLEDMGPRPGPEYSLDRIDNNGSYSPENCRWALPKEQARNTRVNHLLTFHGETHCLSAWAEKTGLKRTTIRARLQRGWSTARALTQPIRGKLSL
jgi:hypothetical protein